MKLRQYYELITQLIVKCIFRLLIQQSHVIEVMPRIRNIYIELQQGDKIIENISQGNLC